MQTKRLYKFKEFELDPDNLVLYRDEEIVPLKPKAFETLFCLVSRHGEVVSKDEIMSEVWPDSFVEENSLSRNIHEIRKTLSEIEEGEYIETIPTRGYRFIAETELVETGDGSAWPEGPAEENAPQREGGRGVRWHFVAVVILCGLFMTSFTLWWRFSEEGALANVPINKRNIRSLAILPLKPIRDEQESDVVSLGVSDELISKIAGLDRFRVSPLSTVRRYQKSERGIIDIGKELQVDAILVGTLHREGSRFRVNLRLWDVRDGAQIWTHAFSETESDIFKLQEDLAVEVAGSLLNNLTANETASLKKRSTTSSDAYRLYLRGRYEWDKRTKEGLRRSVDYFRQAIETDPAFAAAYAGLADSYVIFNDYGLAPPEESYSRAKAAARKALEIDPSLTAPRATLAYVLATYDWDYTAADSEYRKAIESAPNYATARQWYGEMFLMTGNYKDALRLFEEARDIDPLVPIIRSEIAVTEFYEGDFDASVRDLQQLKAEHPGFPTSYMFLARNYEQQGRFSDALDEELEFWKKQEMPAEEVNELRQAFESGGEEKYLDALADYFERRARREYVYEYVLAHIYARKNDRENCLKWLRKGVDNRSANIYKSYIDPNFHFLKDDPEYQVLMSKMNFPWKPA